MNKLFMTLGAIAIISMATGCSNKSESSTEQTAQQETTVVETPAQKNLKDGKEYMDNLRNDSDVTFTPSGLAYRVVKEGKGAKPTPENTANVKYTGKHINGEVFDSSNGEAIPFPLEHVVPGFTEGITLMSPGAIYELYLPASLAYGEMGTPGGPIGPNETLIFEVELVDFN